MSDYKPTDLRPKTENCGLGHDTTQISCEDAAQVHRVLTAVAALQRAAEQVVVYGLDPARLEALRAALVRVDGEGAS